MATGVAAQLEGVAVGAVGHADAASGRPLLQPRSSRSAPAPGGRGVRRSPRRGCGQPSPGGRSSPGRRYLSARRNATAAPAGGDADRPRRPPTARRAARRPRPASRPAARRSASSPGRRSSTAPSRARASPARPRSAASLFTPAANVTRRRAQRHQASDLQLQRRRHRGQQHGTGRTAPRPRRAARGDTRPRAPAASAPATEPTPIAAGQQRVGGRGAVPGEVREQRQQHLEVERDRPDQRHHRQRDQQLGRAPHVAQRAAHLAARALRRLGRLQRARRPSSAAR